MHQICPVCLKGEAAEFSDEDWLAQQQVLHQLEHCQMDLVKITTSFSWRITKPLRAPINLFNSMTRRFK